MLEPGPVDGHCGVGPLRILDPKAFAEPPGKARGEVAQLAGPRFAEGFKQLCRRCGRLVGVALGFRDGNGTLRQPTVAELQGIGGVLPALVAYAVPADIPVSQQAVAVGMAGGCQQPLRCPLGGGQQGMDGVIRFSGLPQLAQEA
jgi:hypothetical protein